MFDLEDANCELGVGIHGEKGYKRVPMMNAKDCVRTMLANILQHTGNAK